MLNHTITILFFFCLFAIYCSESAAQDCCAADFKERLKKTAKNLDNIDEVHQYFQQIIKNIKSDSNCPDDLLAHTYRRYGQTLYYNKNTPKAQALSKFDTIIFFSKLPNQQSVADMDLLKAYALGGQCYEKLLRYDKAKSYLNNAISIQQKINYTKYIEYYYSKLGKIHRSTGNYENAISDSQKSVQLYINNDKYGKNHNLTGMAWNELGMAYTENKKFLKATDALNNAISIAQKNKKIRQITKAYNNLGNAYDAQKDYQKAKETYDLVIKLCVKNSMAPIEDCIKAQNNLGFIHTQFGQYQEAQDILLQALQAKKNHQNDVAYHYSYSATLENFGDLELAKSNHNVALNYYQKALMNLSDNFRNTDIFNNPTPEKNEFIYSKIDLIRILDLKAKAALSFFEKNKNEQYLQLALDTYKAVDEWITLFYRDIATEKSKLEWIARTHDIYANAIHVALEAQQPEHAFHFAERARAVLLWQSLSEQTARTMLTPRDRETEDSINIEIRFQETAYFDADPHEKDSLQILIQDLNRTKERLVKSFEKKYPEYHKRKYNTDFISLKEVQNNIIGDSKTALLEYFLTEKLLYIFIINKNKIIAEKINIHTDFYKNINNFNYIIKNQNSTLDQFVPPAYELYQTILAPALHHVNDEVEKLILIPDGRLNYVTFEALLTDTTAIQNWQSPNYLIDDYTVNYMYSCNSAHSTQEIKGTKKDPYFLGIAPAFGAKYGTPQLAPLFDNDDEIQDIKELYKGSILLGADATRQQLVDRAKGADIIHIASHATQGEGEGKIYLYGGDVMTQKDIQAFSWSAQQVILSACETGTGELSKGEGVLSLGWSFAYKGVPSIVMSQWAVSSKSTTELMVRYHKKIQEQLPADQALRQAKLEFRNNARAMIKAHPYHWAAFIHVGNTTQPKNNRYTWLMLALGLLTALLYTKNRLIS